MLNERQRAFARHWRGRGSGVEAARAAGYQGTPAVLRVQAARLVKDPEVRAEVARLRAQAGAETAEAVEELATTIEAASEPPPELSPRHRAFVDAYFGDAKGVAAEAARLAGYTAKNAGARLMSRADVRAAVAHERARLDAEAVASRREVEQILTAIARDGGQRGTTRIRAARELGLLRGWYVGSLGTAPAVEAPPSSGAAIVVWKDNGRGPAPPRGD